MATVDKNFRIKNGLVVEGSTATVNGQNILAEGTSDTYIINLIGGTATDQNTPSTVVKRDANGDFSAGTITANAVTLNGSDLSGLISSAQSNAEDYADSLAPNYDAAGSAATAESNAISSAASDATTKANAAQSAAQSYADGLAVNYDAAGSAATAESNANSYTDTAITNEVTARNSAIATAKSEAISDANAYTDQEVAALVSGAPALLDTLNELAAAIADNPNYATDVANLVATKADTTYVDSEISDLDTAAQGYANSAQSAAQSYADGLAVNYDAAGSAATAESNANTYTDTAVNNGNSTATPTYAGINFGWVSKDFANYQWIANGSQTVVATWPISYATAKLIVHLRNGIHSQASEIMIARDSSNNIAISEYGIVTTNGSLGDITATVNGNNIELKVTPTHNDGTDVAVRGSSLIWAD